MTAEDLHKDVLIIDDRTIINLKIFIPDISTIEHFDNWALALLEKKNWSDDTVVLGFEASSDHGRLFVQAILQTVRLLCELGRLPVFDVPRIISFSEDNQTAKKYTLEIELPVVQFVDHTAYRNVVNTALMLCRWMAQNQPTLENKRKVFNTVTEKVIKPLRKLVPGGKSTIPVLKDAHSLGIPFMHLGAGVYQLGWGSKARRMDRSTTELDSSMGAKLAQNKVIASNLLRLAGLPAPSHVLVLNEAEALSAADQLGFPVVIKPTDRDRGEGVSVDVLDRDTVKLAFAHAHEQSKAKQVIVERQVSGVCHRLFIANGQLLYAVKRLPMSVMADGRRTVNQLVDDEVTVQRNKAPWIRSEIQPIDERAIQALASAGFSPKSIPAEGVWVPLRRIESTADGGVDEEVTSIVHPDNLSAAIAAAKLFGLHIAGIDIISPDISKPWYENGAIINEVNFAPLFGGGEISRSHIPRFFAEFIDGDGKIPIEAFDTEEAALARQAAYRQKGKRCYFTTLTKTIDFSGKPLIMPFNDIRLRLRALVCRSDVDAIAYCLPSSKV